MAVKSTSLEVNETLLVTEDLMSQQQQTLGLIYHLTKDKFQVNS